jgi:L-amino acid N-acyltransferase YncA
VAPNSTTPTIRLATEADIAAITAIYDHHVRYGTATFELDSPDEAEMLRRYRATVQRGWPYIVAEVDGAVLGYAYGGQYRPRIGYRFTVEDSIYIHHEHTGKGLGRALLTELIVRCERAGFRQMLAVIGDSSNVASIKLHEQFGFTMVGTLKSVCWKFERWVDSVLMQKPLGEGEMSKPSELLKNH